MRKYLDIENAALGYAFNASDLLYNFPVKKIKTSAAARMELSTNHAHLRRFARFIFLASVPIIMEDIIENDVAVHLPNAVDFTTAVLGITVYTEERALKLRQIGTLLDIDMLKTFFSLPLITFTTYKRGRKKEISVIYSNTLKQRLVEKANAGFNYGKSKDVLISYYAEKLHEKFPTVELSDIKIILSYGWRSLLLHITYGGSVFLRSQSFLLFIGNVPFRYKRRFINFYINNLFIKMKVTILKCKVPVDGYRYFGLSASLYERYCQGERKFKVYMFKYFDLCDLKCYNLAYIMRVRGLQYRFKECHYYLPDNAEVYLKREPLHFSDILVGNKRYNILDITQDHHRLLRNKTT